MKKSKYGGKTFDDIYNIIRDEAIKTNSEIPSKERVQIIVDEMEKDGLLVRRDQ
jgi:hypothetical protein